VSDLNLAQGTTVTVLSLQNRVGLNSEFTLLTPPDLTLLTLN